MGYHTYFYGKFDLNKPLDDETYEFLKKLAETRRMKRNVDPKYGVEGEFYVLGGGSFGQAHEDNIIDYNRPPSTQPSLWNHWEPTEDKMHIEHNGGEKFYCYVEWIQYIIKNILAPKGYVLDGTVHWSGEEDDDKGDIIIAQNQVTTQCVGDKLQIVDDILGNKEVLPVLLGINKDLDRLIQARLKESG